jgi:LacI family transcriptional regulator
LELRKWNGDGIIAALDDPQIREIVSTFSGPVVGFGDGKGSRGLPIPYFATDDVAIAQLGAEHLLERGFSNYAYCGGHIAAEFYQPWSENRAAAFVHRIRQAGYECSVFRDECNGSENSELLCERLGKWIATLAKPVGIMADYDVRALYVLEACNQLSIRVPEEVAVIGVDNEELICELATPPLTSVVQSAIRLGYNAARVLDDMMRGTLVEDLAFTIPPEGIVTRQSTDILAFKDPEVVDALRYIRKLACDGICVTDVVKHTSLCRHSLDARFKNALGRSVHGEIQRVQIERVKVLLRSTSLPTNKIAKLAGFRYREYLSTVFHRITGQTLIEYRDHVSASEATGCTTCRAS